MTESIRLSKRLAEQIACSRTEAEQYIEGGWVQVDGMVVEEAGFRILPHQQVEVAPEASLEAILPVTILLNKRPGDDINTALRSIAADNMTAGDRSGLRFLKRHLVDLKIADPLELKAGGLLVFTQDWRMARKLIDDAAKVEHEYIAEVSGNIAPDGLALLNHGLSFNGRALAPVKVSWQNETRLRFALKGGKPFQITHACEQVGLHVVALKRIRIGRLPMAGLPEGQWRYLLGYERF